ncbi:MAG: FAD:protein FMN transferase [Lachnospiraceae bacterium]|nr:FAD:protein FMN transferase [Lachnospiraceae bacterium]
MKLQETGVKYICILLLNLVLITGCGTGDGLPHGSNKELVKTGFAFNTTYTITLYAGGSEELLDKCVSKCNGFEKIFSRTLKGSELYNINEIEKAYKDYLSKAGRDIKIKKGDTSFIEDGIKKLADPSNQATFHLNTDGSISFEVSDILYEILEKGLYYSEISDGCFDITIEPESSLWQFMADNPEVPEDSQIKEAVKLTGYKNAVLKDGQLVLKIPGMGIELGAIAKGFIADKLKEYLAGSGVTSGTINLGGNVLCIGKKTDGTPFRIGIQQPFADRNEIITAIKAEDISVVSSGIYERYFKKDGKIYHHILDPSTGYPYNNGLEAITIISKKSTDGDALSTTCFALGLEKGMEFAESLSGVYAVFITEDGEMHYSEGFQEMEIKN